MSNKNYINTAYQDRLTSLLEDIASSLKAKKITEQEAGLILEIAFKRAVKEFFEKEVRHLQPEKLRKKKVIFILDHIKTSYYG